jgi:hypothetical protein
MILITPPRIPWQHGILLIMRAFNGVPDDFDDWSIVAWEDIVEASKKIIEADFKKGIL